MSRGLPARPFPIFLSGGLDTKTDPRLVPAGSTLEIENMFYQRTGELRLRNGFTALPPGGGQTQVELTSLWPDARGRLVEIAKTSTNFGTPLGCLSMKRYSATAPTYRQTTAFESLYPAASCERLSGAQGETYGLGIATSTPNPIDGDVTTDGTHNAHCWLEGALTANGSHWVSRRDEVVMSSDENSGVNLGNGGTRPPVAATSGTGLMAMFQATGGQIPTMLYAFSNGGFTLTTSPGALSTALVASPLLDAKGVPGSVNIVVAYNRTGGGVHLALLNASSGALVNNAIVAAVDGNQTLGWLDDASATGFGFLVSAGTTSGIVCRTINLTTLAVTATDVIDAAATANVRQVTGYTNGSATNYYVHWDLTGTPLWQTRIKRSNVVAGVPTNLDLLYGVSLYSRAFKATDGRYYLLTSYDSASAQSSYFLFRADHLANSIGRNPQLPLCLIFPRVAAGRRVNTCSLTSAYLDSSGRSVLSAGRSSSDGAASQERIALTFGGTIRARELGGLSFSTGGLVMSDDGSERKWAAHALYPEPITAVSAAGGAMTSLGAYDYVAIYVERDSQGNKVPSAKSVAGSVTITAGQGTATLTLQNPRIFARTLRSQVIEIYRRGPSAAGDANYNKIGEVFPDPTAAANTLTFSDTTSDANAELGEELYSTGNVLENFSTPSTRLLEVCGGRLWIASAETVDELWPSKEFKPGDGVGFNPLLAFRVTGDGYGAITALAQMDSRLIVFKSGAIYAISGDGPNDLGQGAFNQPQIASLSNGTTNPGSVVATPDGVLFQSTKGGGLWLLDRGLGLTYAGAGVEQYTISASIVGASLVNGTTQVRFVLADGRCLVLDYSKKTPVSPAGSWTTFLLRVQGSTVVACADIPAGWCYACADGRVYQETPSVFSDVNSVSTIAIIPAVTFPILAVGGINGFARMYAVDILGEYVGDHTFSAALTVDYDLISTPRTKVITAATGALQMQVKPTVQKGTAYRLRLTSSHAAGSGAFRLSAVTLWAGIKRGSSIPDTKRIP